MHTPASLFNSFSPLLRSLSESELRAEIAAPTKLLIDRGTVSGKQIEIAYAPDHITANAKIVIVGLSPGASRCRTRCWQPAGHSETEAAERAKVFASFSGPMRKNLVALLDYTGVQRLLGIKTTDLLWSSDLRPILTSI